MNRRHLRPLPAVALMLCAGCAHIRYYADAERTPVATTALTSGSPIPVRLDTSFLINGERHPELDGLLRAEVQRVLDESRLMRASDSPATSEVLSVKVNDLTAMQQTGGNSFVVAGLTYGAKPVSRVTDRYEFELRYRNAAGDERFATDRDAIWTVYGTTEPPSVRGPYRSPGDVFGVVIEDTLFAFLKQVAETSDTRGSLTFLPQQPPQAPATPPSK